MAFVSGDVNSHRDQDIRRALAPLAKLAEETGAAMVVVRHLNKSSGGNPLYRGGGSIGIIGAARSALLVATHPEDDSRRVLANLKSNLAPPAPSLVFVLSGAANGAVRIEYKGGTPLKADALLAASPDLEQRPAALNEARGFLLDALRNGPREAKAIKDDAYAADISEITLKRAKAALKIRSKKGADGTWSWHPPERRELEEDPSLPDDPLDPLDPLPAAEPLSESQAGKGDQEAQGAQAKGDEPLAPLTTTASDKEVE